MSPNIILIFNISFFSFSKSCLCNLILNMPASLYGLSATINMKPENSVEG